MTAPHNVAFDTIDRLGPCEIAISWLNPTPHTIVVYASPRSSPSTTQHSLPGGRYPLPGPDLHRLDRASFAWRTNDRLELALQIALGPCLIATDGPLSDAAVANFTRARELCEQLGSPPEHQHVLHWLSVMHVVRGELRKGLEATETATELAETRDDRPALINSLRGEALVKLLMGRLEDSRERAERAIAMFDAADAGQQLATRSAGQDAGVASLAVASWALWALGYANSAAVRITAALERARSFQHPHTQAYATYYASVLHALRGESASSLEHAETCLALAETHGFAQWRGLSRIVRLLASVRRSE